PRPRPSGGGVENLPRHQLRQYRLPTVRRERVGCAGVGAAGSGAVGAHRGVIGSDHLNSGEDRVRKFTAARRGWERVQAIVSAGGWPARLARAFGNPMTVIVEKIDVEVSAPLESPLRLAFASDFHAGPTTHPELIAHACDALESLAPDALLLGGD